MRNYNEAVAQHGIATLNTTVRDWFWFTKFWLLIAIVHNFLMGQCDQAHEYAAFAIWHSMVVREFEIALQSINPSVYVPYWWVESILV